ncbi:hypothetical protein EJ03DRAFT_329019 [Teratosphaeria nubilosa]|uniref:Uncharacterized protein n=1 Tax=Teratosphaeria nubilosa TaxID=161662 RepID=A0A6G1L610_9PEZI|nr:hypothetical protein EJ03DRAFT_329019 [Teratosphaeria nubilosa]
MDQSPFGRLPPELRNRIYGFVFECDRILLFGNPDVTSNIQHPLTRTCKALR